MTRVSIVPIQDSTGGVTYSAIAGENQAFGNTAGEALDALTALMDTDENTLVIVQHRHPDTFFGREQQRRLESLMTRWREARDRGLSLSDAEQQELETLVAAELHASALRAASIAAESRQ